MDYDYCSFRREAGLRVCSGRRARVRGRSATRRLTPLLDVRAMRRPSVYLMAPIVKPRLGGPFDCGNLVEDGLGMEDNLRWVMMNEADTAGRVCTETAGMDTAKDR